MVFDPQSKLNVQLNEKKNYLDSDRKDVYFIFVKIFRRWKRIEFGRVIVGVGDDDIDWNTNDNVAAVFSFQFKRITLFGFKIKNDGDGDCTIIWDH